MTTKPRVQGPAPEYNAWCRLSKYLCMFVDESFAATVYD